MTQYDDANIYILTQTPEDFEVVAKVCLDAGYSVHFPEIYGSQDLITTHPEGIATVMIDLDLEGIDGIGHIRDILHAATNAAMDLQLLPPILAVSYNEKLLHPAQIAGAERALDKSLGDQIIAQTLINLDENDDAPTIGAAIDRNFPTPDPY